MRYNGAVIFTEVKPMNETLTEWLESLPYSAVAVPEEKGRVYRNRLARRLLPPPSRLTEALRVSERELLSEVCLDGIRYLVVRLPAEKASLYCLFEHFSPLQEMLSRGLVGRMQNFLWDLMDREEKGEPCASLSPDQIAARARSLRMHSDGYLRLLNVGEHLKDKERATCCLDGFFGYLQRALSACDVSASFRFREGCAVVTTGEELSFLVLNLIHLAHLFETERSACLEAREEESGVRFSIEFRDGGAVASSLEEMIRFGKSGEGLLCSIPLLCVLRVCLERGIPWSVRRNGENLACSFLLPKGTEKPVLFLSDPAAEEVSALLRTVRTFFF